VEFTDYLPDGFPKRDLVIVAHSQYAAINGNISKGECLFPHIQFSNSKQINITASAWESCPITFQPNVNYDFFLAFASKDRAIQLLHKSILEFSQNRANFAIVYLYSAIEAASARLSGQDDGKLSNRFSVFIRKIAPISSSSGKIMKRLKKKIEKRIIVKRGDFAHKGNDLTKDDLLQSYETALEFFWHYSAFKELADE
jgi:hypothetical protein